MTNNEELVLEETENTEELPVEEVVEEYTESAEPIKEEEIPVKTYTEEEFNARLDELLAKKIARKEAKIRKEYEDKYSTYKDAETVLNAGLGTSNIQEATENLRNFYTNKGIVIPESKPLYDERTQKLIAEDDARVIIEAGYDDIVDELDRLSHIGLENMNPGDKLLFQRLAEKEKEIRSEKELASIGVSKDEIEKEDVKTYFSKLNPELSLKEKWDMYLSQKPKEPIESIGSLKDTKPNATKEYYTEEEVSRLTEEDLDNPDVWEAVVNSMRKWSK